MKSFIFRCFLITATITISGLTVPNTVSAQDALKVRVGDGEMQRRAYGEAHFNLVIKDLKQRHRLSVIDKNGIQLRIAALEKLLPKQASVKQYSGQIYNYYTETRILPWLDRETEKAKSITLPLSLKKCPEYC